MLIQPSVQSASYTTTFASSVSATGVEQSVARAPLPPVEQATRDASPQNQTNAFQTAPPNSLAEAKPGAASAPAQAKDADAAGADEPAADKESADAAQSALQKQQEASDQALLAQLKARDREVKIHEAAHAAVGGRYAGSASFEYRRGPDGQNYAVGGEVSISTGAVSGDPQATIEKARTIRAAALAPAEPSSQDRRVAAEAAQLELDARTELRQEEVKARAEAEKAREQSVAEKKAKDAQEESASTETDSTPASEAETEIQPVFTPVQTVSTSDATDEEADDSSGSAKKDGPRPNARQELEKILLGPTGILVQANKQGLVDPQNPYGKSGFLDVIA